MEGEHLLERGRLRQDVNERSPLGQLPRAARLDPQVDGRHHGDGLGAGEGPGGLDDVVLPSADLGGQASTGHGRRGAHGIQADVDGGP